MAITNFIPEVWSANILVALRKKLVYASPGIINRDYEGDIAEAGDTVHITSFDDVTVNSYTRNEDIDWELLSDDDQTLVIDAADYFAFQVDDIDRRQALPGFVAYTSDRAAYKMAVATDTYVSTKMAAGVASGNKIGSVTCTSGDDAYDLILELRNLLTKSLVPDQSRFVVVPTDFYALLLQNDLFIRAYASGDQANEGLRQGLVGRVLGLDVFESQTVPVSGGVHTIIAGHGMASTFAEQIVKTEGIRLPNTFADGVRGLHVYGGKVVRDYCLASAAVTISTS